MRSFALIPLFACAVLSADPSNWWIYGSEGENCEKTLTRVDVNQEGTCQKLGGDYKSYNFAQEGGRENPTSKIFLFEDSSCTKSIDYKQGDCIGPDVLNKGKYFKVCWNKKWSFGVMLISNDNSSNLHRSSLV